MFKLQYQSRKDFNIYQNTMDRYLYRRQLGLRTSLKYEYLLQSFELSHRNEDPVIGDSLDAESQTSCSPLACEFCPVPGCESLVAVADELGYIVIYDTRFSLTNSQYKSFAAHDNAIFDISWLKHEAKLITASGDQTLSLIDMQTNEIIDRFKAHTGSVKSVDVQPLSNAVFASGSRDGHIMMWDCRCSRKAGTIPPVNTIRNAHCVAQPTPSKLKRKSRLGPPLDSQQSVTIVVHQSDVNLVSAGAVDGVIKVWDLRKNYCICGNEPIAKLVFSYPGCSERQCGYSSMTFDSYHTRLYVNCTDDSIYEYDFATYNPIPLATYRGHQNKTFYVKSALSPDNRFILSGSSDGSAHMYQVGLPETNAVLLPEHNQEVTGVSWSPYDFSKILTLCDDNTVRLWRLTPRPDDYRRSSDIHCFAELKKSCSEVTPRKRPYSDVTSPQSLTPVIPAKKPTPKSQKSSFKPKSIYRWLRKESTQTKISNDFTYT